MNTYGLLDFELVDRKKERNVIEKFLNSSEKYLWINGDTDTGKSFLATEFNWRKFNYDYIRIVDSDENRFNFFEGIVSAIEEKSESSFKKYLVKNYKGLIDLAKGPISLAIDKFVFKDNEYIKKIGNGIVSLVGNDGKKKVSSKVITQYIKQALVNQNIIIILDDIDKYSNDNFNKLKAFLADFIEINSDKIKIILITDSHCNNNILNFFTHKLSCDYMYLEPFKDNLFFAEIILPKFPNDNRIFQYVPRIFNICNGYPEKLKSFFQALLLNDQYIFRENNNNLVIDYDKFDNFINNYSDLMPNKFTFNHQLILKTILCIHSPINLNNFINIVISLGQNILFHNFEYFEIYSSVNELITLQILKLVSNRVTIFSSGIYNNLLQRFKNSIPDNNMINYYIFRFLKDNEDISDNSFTEDEYWELYSYFAYLTESNDWIEKNYIYAIRQVIQCEFSIASKIFDRFANHLSSLEDIRLLEIAKCYYKNGEYLKTNKILEQINPDNLQNSDRFYYHFLQGKCFFVILETDKSTNCFLKAIELACDDNDKYLALNMLIQSYREKSNEFSVAETTFLNFLSKKLCLIEEVEPSLLPLNLSGILRNSVFFTSIEEAVLLCRKAISISSTHDDKIGEGFAKNNLAYCYIKQDKINKARRLYYEAKDLVSSLPHEMAYCLNNIAVCDMFNNDYEEALKHLTQASILCTSFYANYCIETHTMICNLKLNRTKTALEIAENLFYKVNNKVLHDLTIKRRVNMNLCIVYFNLGKLDKARDCLNHVLPTSTGTLSEYRAAYYNKLLNNPLRSEPQFGSLHDTTIDFEPWLIMFSHD